MPFITREDGEHFVIPSYRDVLTARSKSQLKKDILLLSQSYGEYITMQRKTGTQYEVAFSPDTGYLLGETVWHQFKRPLDMIYCEAIPNTMEALLVIVKNGSVYLDGSFPLDSIPEELIIFLTQKNNFEIYIYGDVPISQVPEEGKFSFEANSVKSFTVLDKPVFPTLPLLRMYQLQLVDQVLKAQGIGVFPIRSILIGIILLLLLWMAYRYFSTEKPEIIPTITKPEVNPYQGYYDALNSPAPDEEMDGVVNAIILYYSMPGWEPISAEYNPPTFTAAVRSNGGKVEDLFNWARANDANLEIQQDGFYLSKQFVNPKRPPPKNIFPIKQTIGNFVDRITSIYPGNHIRINSILNQGSFTTITFDLTLEQVSPLIMGLIGDQFKGLPFVLRKITLSMAEGTLTGTISMDALGN